MNYFGRILEWAFPPKLPPLKTREEIRDEVLAKYEEIGRKVARQMLHCPEPGDPGSYPGQIDKVPRRRHK